MKDGGDGMYTEHKLDGTHREKQGRFPIGCLLCQVNEATTSFVSESLDVGFVCSFEEGEKAVE